MSMRMSLLGTDDEGSVVHGDALAQHPCHSRVAELMSCLLSLNAASANDAAAKATYPAFRDELVTTLLVVVDRHPWAARSQELLTGPDPDALAALPRCASIRAVAHGGLLCL